MLPTRRSAFLVHIAAGLGFFALAIWMSYPLIRHLGTHVPGWADKTLRNVRGAWVKSQKVAIENGKITEYRVLMKVSFVLND